MSKVPLKLAKSKEKRRHKKVKKGGLNPPSRHGPRNEEDLLHTSKSLNGI